MQQLRLYRNGPRALLLPLLRGFIAEKSAAAGGENEGEGRRIGKIPKGQVRGWICPDREGEGGGMARDLRV